MFSMKREVYVGLNEKTGNLMGLDLNEEPVEAFDTGGSIVREGDPGDVEFFMDEDGAKYWAEQFPQYKPIKVKVVITQIE